MEQQAEAAVDAGLDTFDDGPYTDGPMDEGTDDGGGKAVEAASEEQSTEEVSEQAEAKEEIDPDSQVNMLDDSEEKAEKKTVEAPKDNREGDKEQQESKSDGEDKTPEATDAPAEEVRNLKAFRGDKQYEIPEDAAVRMKVKGKWEKVPLTELRDNYAGKVAYDEKFQGLEEKVKNFEQREQGYNQEIEGIRTHLGKIAELTTAALKGEVDPIANMEYLLDLMGGNSLEYKKVMFENMAEQLDIYSHMTESEREAYWTKQENNYLIKKQESLTKSQSEEQAQAELQRETRELREAHGISEEDYDSAKNDLLAGGLKPEELNPTTIVNAARMKPLLLEADRLLEPYAEQMSDEEMNSMSIEIAKTMFEAPSLPIEQIKNLLAEQYEVESIVDTLVKKTETAKPKDVSVPNKEPDHLESFDDFDY